MINMSTSPVATSNPGTAMAAEIGAIAPAMILSKSIVKKT
jgi:hypothetical protein